MRTKFRHASVYILASIVLFIASSLAAYAVSNSVGGKANGATVSATVRELGIDTNLTLASVAQVTLPSTGGDLTDTVASVSVGVPAQSVLQTGVVTNTTSGSVGASSAHAESSSTVHDLNILNGLVTADTIVAKSTSDGDGTTATSTGAGSSVTNLFVAGVSIASQPAPNTVILISGFNVGLVLVSGTVTLNEQTATGNGTTTSGLTVNQIHVNVSGGNALTSVAADVVVAIAASNVDFTAAPTAVELVSFNATSDDLGSVLLQWQTGFEVDNLGFSVYREEGGKRTRLNPQMIAGSALVAGPQTALTAGESYAWFDNSPAGSEARYWLEEVDLSGRSRWHGPAIIKHRKISASRLRQALLLSALGEAQTHESLTRSVERTATMSPLTPALGPIQSSLASSPAIKLSVRREGWYRVTQQQLLDAGLDPNIDPRLLQLYVDGKQQPISVSGEKDGRLDAWDAVEYYGIGLDTRSTDSRTYWLVPGSQPGTRIQRSNERGAPNAATCFPYTVERRDKSIYLSGVRNGGNEKFLGAVVSKDSTDQSLVLQHIDRTARGLAELEVVLQGLAWAPHRVRVVINGTEATEVAFDGQAQGIAKLSLPQTIIKEGENLITLTALGGDLDVSLVDRIRLTYWHSYTADNNALRLSASANQQVSIGGFTNGQIRVIDVTGSTAVEISATVKHQKDGYGITFGVPGSSEHRLLAFAEDRVEQPAAITPNLQSSWHQTNNGADLAIITRRDFATALAPLVALRQSQGLSVAVIDIEDIYDEFSFGHKNTDAVKEFLSYARSSWKKAPRFVLFVGDASYDPRNYLGFGYLDLVPSKLLETDYMETASDDYLADFDGDNLPEMGVGRLPARTALEASNFVSKIVGYEHSSPEGVLLVADRNNGYDFESASSNVRQLIPPGVAVQEIMRGRTDDATAHSRIVNAINRGPRIVNYIGHGSTRAWAGGLLRAEDGPGLTNEQGPALVVAMTCLNGTFQRPDIDILAESLLKSERGGAVAVWASSGFALAGRQAPMNRELFRLIFDGDRAAGQRLTLGEATARAKAATSDVDVRRTWILFGDPSMRLK